MDKVYVIFYSGNHALYVCETMIKQGVSVEFVSTPCNLSKDGCSYAVCGSLSDLPFVIEMASRLGIKVREVYKASKLFNKYKYEKIPEFSNH